MNTEIDTIAALATAAGEAGIAIVRVSGPGSLGIADGLVRCSGARPSARPSHVVLHGWVGAVEAGGTVDEVVVVQMRGPRSYTREDVVEIQCHGGAVAARRILRAVLDAGARPAEPGEFTKRAFLNGRIDLLQAEAVLDLIRARSDRAAQAAVEQLSGRLSDAFNTVYDALLAVAADLEATLDFSDGELPETVLPDIRVRLGAARGRLGELLATWDEGHLLRDGALVVISGRPNVGKSTLFNGLLGTDRAIVTHVPGTTRDTIEERVVLEGIPLRLVDTAGLRETDCDIEREGISRALKYVENADVHIRLVDAAAPVDAAEREQIAGLADGKTVVVLNKTDLGCVAQPSDFSGKTVLRAALIRDEGLSEIRAALRSKLHIVTGAPAHAVISERHRQTVLAAQPELARAESLLRSEREDVEVLAVEHLRAALETLGQVTGRTYHDELLDSVFSRFCVGK